MIHVCFGTQAELIKLAPVLKALADRSVPHRIIDTGQHPGQTELLRQLFGLRPPDVTLHRGPGVFSTAMAAAWAGRILAGSVINRRGYRQGVFAKGPGCCVVHGDTLTTLLVAILTRSLGLRLVHVESGLRSFRWLNPFPEEIVRVVANRWADVLFAPGKWACDNLAKMKVSGRVVRLPANTGKDSLEAVLAMANSKPAPNGTYALASIHRYETVTSPRAMAQAVEIVAAAARKAKVIWPLHTVTRRAMEKGDLLKDLVVPNVELRDPLPYAEFARLLAGAAFVIADGGSIQEEAYFLDKPCLLLRHATERREGIGENCLLSKWRRESIEDFLRDPSRYRRHSAPAEQSPSAVLVDELVAFEDSLHRE